MTTLQQDVRRLVDEFGLLRRDVAQMREEWAGGRERLADVEEDFRLVDKRVTLLERWRWTVYGGAAAVTVIVQPLLSLVNHK